MLRGGSFRSWIFYQFETLHEAHSANLADDRIFFLQLFKFAAQVATGSGSVRREIFFLDEIDDGFSGGSCDGIAAESGNVNAFPSVGHFWARDREANRQTVTEAFGAGHYVGRNTPLFDAEPFIAGAAPTGLHFIANENTAVFANDVGNNLEIFLGRSDETANALDGFGDHASDATRCCGPNEFFHVLCAFHVARRIGKTKGAAITIRVVRENDAGLRLRTDFPGCVTSDGESHGGPTMIGVAQGNDVSGTRIAAREHDGGFIGFGTAVGKKRLLQVVGSDRRDFLREGDLGLSEKNSRNVLQFVQLLFNFGVDFIVTVAHADGEDAAEKIKILVAVRIPNELVFGAFDDERVFEVVKDGRKQEFFLRENNFLFGH